MVCAPGQMVMPDPSKKAVYDEAFQRHLQYSNALFDKQP